MGGGQQQKSLRGTRACALPSSWTRHRRACTPGDVPSSAPTSVSARCFRVWPSTGSLEVREGETRLGGPPDHCRPNLCTTHLAAVDTVEASRGWSVVVHDVVCEGFAADAESRFRVLLIPGEPAGEAPGTAHAVVVYSHVVGDGTSVFRVFSEWIAAALCDPAAEGRSPLPPLALMPPLCEAFRSPAVRRWADVITAAAAPLIVAPVRRELSGKDNVRPILPVEPSVTRACPLLATGSRDALSASLLRCRAERTTINAALEVAVAAAFALEDSRRRPARCCGGSDVIAMQVRCRLLLAPCASVTCCSPLQIWFLVNARSFAPALLGADQTQVRTKCTCSSRHLACTIPLRAARWCLHVIAPHV